ncbi:hypothetical protein V6N11_022121 [Hibiscus sabdariffa]|uniref:Uncharacterized protein n=1 Tax=Hibiscus sabdariffa TaxID=183260 RepID=A0ABR2TI83_9ROSI
MVLSSSKDEGFVEKVFTKDANPVAMEVVAKGKFFIVGYSNRFEVLVGWILKMLLQVRQNRVAIRSLKADDGVVLHTHDDIAGEAVRFFQDLFGSIDVDVVGCDKQLLEWILGCTFWSVAKVVVPIKDIVAIILKRKNVNFVDVVNRSCKTPFSVRNKEFYHPYSISTIRHTRNS